MDINIEAEIIFHTKQIEEEERKLKIHKDKLAEYTELKKKKDGSIMWIGEVVKNNDQACPDMAEQYVWSDYYYDYPDLNPALYESTKCFNITENFYHDDLPVTVVPFTHTNNYGQIDVYQVTLLDGSEYITASDHQGDNEEYMKLLLAEYKKQAALGSAPETESLYVKDYLADDSISGGFLLDRNDNSGNIFYFKDKTLTSDNCLWSWQYNANNEYTGVCRLLELNKIIYRILQ